MEFTENKWGLTTSILFMKYKSPLYLLILCFLISLKLNSQDITFKKELINNMVKNIDKHNNLEFVMERNERNEKGFKKGRFFC
jgi:hypothetical protein